MTSEFKLFTFLLITIILSFKKSWETQFTDGSTTHHRNKTTKNRRICRKSNVAFVACRFSRVSFVQCMFCCVGFDVVCFVTAAFVWIPSLCLIFWWTVYAIKFIMHIFTRFSPNTTHDRPNTITTTIFWSQSLMINLKCREEDMGAEIL